MTVEFTLPDIGEGLHEAEVVRWLVDIGDTVERNQPFVEILTDKSTVEMPAPAAGEITRLGAEEGDMVQVGELLVVIEDGDTPSEPQPSTPSAAAPAPAPAAPVAEPAPATVPGGDTTPAAPARRPKASPSTRRLAATLGIDLGHVAGSGPGGRITAADVRAHGDRTSAKPTPGPSIPAPAATSARPAESATLGTGPATDPPPSGRMDPGVHQLRGVRRVTARAMDHSWSTIPHINAMSEIDVEHLLSTRAQLKALRSADQPNITPLVLVLAAIARALGRHRLLNASLDLDAETITVHDRINFGVAVATDHGLLVPVITDADRRDVFDLAAELARLTAAARDRTIAPEELRGGTHTITNFGAHGTEVATPIIRPGEAAITGLGAIATRPFVVDGRVEARPTMSVVVSADHRLVDGDGLSAFHNEVCGWLQSPVGLLL
ncbi:MAG: dihydrolipoamide acetyltransferase family protein [Actinomycetota bacterium]